MKRIILSLAAIIIMGFASGAFAQSEERANPVAKGNLVIKLFDIFGYAGFESGDMYSDIDSDAMGINANILNPYSLYFPVGTEINYFVIDGLAIGGSFYYIQYTEPGSGEDITMKTIGPTLYYYYNLNGAIIPYVTVSYLYSKMDVDKIIERTLIRIPLGAGVTVMAGKYLGFYGQISFIFDSISEDSEDAENGSVVDFKIGVKAFF